MKFSVLAVVLIIVSFIFYNEMTKHNYNVFNIEENEEIIIYNGNYIVSDNDFILENNYDFNNSIETKEISRNYLRWRDREAPNIDFE